MKEKGRENSNFSSLLSFSFMKKGRENSNLFCFSAFDDIFFPSLRIASDFATSPNPGYPYAQPRGWWPPLAFHGKTSNSFNGGE